MNVSLRHTGKKIEHLFDKFRGSSIAILGSGPTLLDHSSEIQKSDIVIACNGSLMGIDTEIPIDYFVCVDKASPFRQWFYRSCIFSNKENSPVTRVLPPYILAFDEIALPHEVSRRSLQRQLSRFEETLLDEEDYSGFKPIIPYEHLNGVTYNLDNWDPELESRGITSGKGTITGFASQLAFKMGADEVRLFGCGFSNSDGRTYAYDNGNEPGITTNKQAQNMDNILQALIHRRRSLRVVSYGKTALQVPDVIYR